MTLSEIYDLAKHTPDYPEFEQLVKCELTGLPYTQVIDCEVEIRVAPENIVCPKCGEDDYWEQLSRTCQQCGNTWGYK